jgi:hypothetical protein
MNPNIERLKLIFISVFALLVVGVTVYQIGWAMPQARCEKEQHRWWDPGKRICATPLLITTITRRPATDKAAEDAARRALGWPAAPTPNIPPVK